MTFAAAEGVALAVVLGIGTVDVVGGTRRVSPLRASGRATVAILDVVLVSDLKMSFGRRLRCILACTDIASAIRIRPCQRVLRLTTPMPQMQTTTVAPMSTHMVMGVSTVEASGIEGGGLCGGGESCEGVTLVGKRAHGVSRENIPSRPSMMTIYSIPMHEVCRVCKT